MCVARESLRRERKEFIKCRSTKEIPKVALFCRVFVRCSLRVKIHYGMHEDTVSKDFHLAQEF